VRVVPLTLKQLNDFVEEHHRHHKKVQGHRFSLGVVDDEGVLRGACSVGRPVNRELNAYYVAGVTRLVTDGTYNACSVLYGAAARTAKAVGFDFIQTYIRAEEPGTSLKASRWVFDGTTSGGNWNDSKAYAGKRRTDQPQGPKSRWRKYFRSGA